VRLDLDQRHDQQVHGEDPDEDYLPEPKIPGTIVVARDMRVAVEKPFSDPENVNPAEEYDREQNAEDDAEDEDRIAMLVDHGDDAGTHSTTGSRTRGHKAA
jgi:hypothetical protein